MPYRVTVWRTWFCREEIETSPRGLSEETSARNPDKKIALSAGRIHEDAADEVWQRSGGRVRDK